MAKVINFTLPVYYVIHRKTKKDSTHLVGQNWFRNIHPHLKNKVKQEYHTIVADLMKLQKEVGSTAKFRTYYKYFYKSKASDGSNVVPQVEKFALDGLKECGIIKDDNVLCNIGSDGWDVEFDKDNPRLEIEIRFIDGRL